MQHFVEKKYITTEIDSYTYERCELAKIIAGTEIKVQRGDDSI